VQRWSSLGELGGRTGVAPKRGPFLGGNAGERGDLGVKNGCGKNFWRKKLLQWIPSKNLGGVGCGAGRGCSSASSPRKCRKELQTEKNEKHLPITKKYFRRGALDWEYPYWMTMHLEVGLGDRKNGGKSSIVGTSPRRHTGFLRGSNFEKKHHKRSPSELEVANMIDLSKLLISRPPFGGKGDLRGSLPK